MGVSNVWLSILLPGYNVEAYLAECIHSIVQQTGCDSGVEIVIVDDCSTDGSRSLVERLCAQFPQHLRLVRHDQNAGVSATRNRLIDEASGEFIWFIDPDDYVLAGAISELRAIVMRCDPDLILCDYRKNRFWKRRTFYGPKKRLSSDLGKLVRGVFKSRKMYCWVKISRRALWLNGLRFPEGRVFEDVATTPWLLLHSSTYYYNPKAWVHYRKRAGSIMDSIRRRPDVFDVAKHDDLARALRGYQGDLRKCFGVPPHSVDYYVADFCAKEFTKTAFRMKQAQQVSGTATPMPAIMTELYSLWEACSPISFKQLMVHYLKRGRLIRYFILRYCLLNILHPAPWSLAKTPSPRLRDTRGESLNQLLAVRRDGA